MTLRDELVTALIKAKIPSPRLEADIILKHAVPEYPRVLPNQEVLVYEMLSRRINHEPLDKIIGHREFYKSFFMVNENVLSPRPDTEILVESTLNLIPEQASWNILDLGTGSGCILLSLLLERSQCQGTGIDASQEALHIATQNAQRLELLSRTKFIHKSWNETNIVSELFDVIVSNPPYIPSAEIAALEAEVRNYDPLTALDGGEDGLNCYREIAKITPLLLKKDGYILLEVGYGQDKDVAEIFIAQKLTWVKTVPDLAGINRCVILKK